MTGPLSYARPPYKDEHMSRANEMARLRSILCVWFKGNHANQIGVMSSVASMALYSLAEDHPLRRHLRAEISLFEESQLVKTSDLLEQDEYCELMEALLRASQAALAPGAAYLVQSGSQPHFKSHCPRSAEKREADWNGREVTLRAQLRESSHSDWHTEAARRLAKDVKTDEQRAKDKEKKEKRKAKTAKSVKSKRNIPGYSSESAFIINLPIADNEQLQPSTSPPDSQTMDWTADTYTAFAQGPVGVLSSQKDSGAFPNPGGFFNNHNNHDFGYGHFDNTMAPSAVAPRLTIPFHSNFNHGSSSFSDDGYGSLRVSPFSGVSPVVANAPGVFEPRRPNGVEPMQCSPNEDMHINDFANTGHRSIHGNTYTPSQAVSPHPQYGVSAPCIDMSFPYSPVEARHPSIVVPSCDPAQVAEGAWYYEKDPLTNEDIWYWKPNLNDSLRHDPRANFSSRSNGQVMPPSRQQQPQQQFAPSPHYGGHYEPALGFNAQSTHVWHIARAR